MGISRRDRELNDEIRSHLEEATDDYIARGMSRKDARDAALRDFGGVTQVAQVYRESRRFAWLEQLLLDLRYAFRMVVRTPTLTFLAVLTLGLGIGLTTAMFSVVRGVVLRPLPFSEPDRLVTLHTRLSNGDIESALSPPNVMSLLWRAATHSRISVCPRDWRHADRRGRGPPR